MNETAKIDSRSERLEARIAEVKDFTRRTAVQTAKLVGEVADIKHAMATKMATKADISLFH